MSNPDRESPAMPGAGAKIVLVHSNPEAEDAVWLLEALHQRDDHCAVFLSGEAALAKCEPSLVGAAVVSLEVPGATSLARKLKELAGEQNFLPVFVVGSPERIRESIGDFDGACDDFIATPIAPEEFQFRLTALLNRQQVHSSLAEVNAGFAREQERRKALASLIVHDLRNPLAAIVGNIQFLEEVLKKPDPLVSQSLADLGELSEKTLSMIGGLLDVEEFERGLLKANREMVDVHGLVARMPSFYKTATTARKLELAVHCPKELSASFDRQLVARILENLLDNAVRYAPRKGNVVLTVSVDRDELVFCVGNDGPAIPASERARMFDRYYQVESSGKDARSNRGLGLYFCRLAAEAHDGTIAVAETPEWPASFVLRLPSCVGVL